VIVGTSPSDLDTLFVQDEAASHYNLTYRHHSGKIEDYYSPYYHHVTVDGLKPSTIYYYRALVRSNLESFHEALEEEQMEKYYLLQEARTETIEKQNALKKLESLRAEERTEENAKHGRQRQLHETDASYEASMEGGCPSPEMVRSFKTAPPHAYPSISLAVVSVQLYSSSCDRIC